MTESDARENPSTAVQKEIPKALPLDLQKAIKEDIRHCFAIQTKFQIVEHLTTKYSIAKRTAYKYIDKTIKEDLKETRKETLIFEVLANRQFRKRQLLSIYSKIAQKEELTKGNEKPYEANPSIKISLMKLLGEEDKLLVDLLQNLGFIEIPVKAEQSSGDEVERIANEMKSIIEKNKIFLKRGPNGGIVDIETRKL